MKSQLAGVGWIVLIFGIGFAAVVGAYLDPTETATAFTTSDEFNWTSFLLAAGPALVAGCVLLAAGAVVEAIRPSVPAEHVDA